MTILISMSRLGKKPIAIPTGVTVQLTDRQLAFSGKGGELQLPLLTGIDAEITPDDGGGRLVFSKGQDTRQSRANWGTMAALARNAIVGVSQGFSKTLEIEGIGYRAAMENNVLVLNVGFTHQVRMATPPGIRLEVRKNQIIVSGIDRALVGQCAAAIRAVKKPEPYKGKGIRYQGEIIRRKVGKKVAGTNQ